MSSRLHARNLDGNEQESEKSANNNETLKVNGRLPKLDQKRYTEII